MRHKQTPGVNAHVMDGVGSCGFTSRRRTRDAAKAFSSDSTTTPAILPNSIESERQKTEANKDIQNTEKHIKEK